MIVARYQYALASGWDVPLANLNNIETHIGQQNRKVSGGKLYPVGISSPVVDLFPVRGELLSGRERGDGFVSHEWNLTLCTYGVKYLLQTYLTTVSTAVTIYTRRHELGSYARYNAYLVLPSRRADDITYVRQHVFSVRLRFSKLEAL